MELKSTWKVLLLFSIFSLAFLVFNMGNIGATRHIIQDVPVTTRSSSIHKERQIFVRKTSKLPYKERIKQKHPMFSAKRPEATDLATSNNKLKRNLSISNRFFKRREHLLQACANKSVYQVRPSLSSIKNKNLLYDKRYNFVYCLVEKIGSTFWKTIFYLLHHSEYSGNLYSIDPSYVIEQKLPTLRKFNVENSKRILASGKTAMFVRDPYERAFSGYVDKLFRINGPYMLRLGRSVIKLLRKNATNASLKCGHDVTFKELLEYLVQMKEKKKQYSVDVHFSQIYTHCLPCEVQYDFIGKMETFDEDTKFLMNDVGVVRKESLEIKVNMSVISRIRDVVKKSLKEQKKMARCMTKEETYNRAWRTLQFRGLVNPNVKAPSYNNASVDFYIQIAIEASDPTRVSEFERKAVVDMYKSVPSNLLNKFREYVLPDCKLFGYNDRPPDIFG